MASDINSVCMVGRLTRDLGSNQYDFSYTSGGVANANVSIAVNRSVKRNEQWQEETSYFDVKIWGKTAENLKSYLTKGKQIAVTGRLVQDRWQDKQTGNNKSRIYIVADNVQLLSKESGGNGGNYANTNQQTDGGYSEDIPF